MKIIKQAILPDINTKVLFIETTKRHFHVVAMATDPQFYSISGRNVRCRLWWFQTDTTDILPSCMRIPSRNGLTAR